MAEENPVGIVAGFVIRRKWMFVVDNLFGPVARFLSCVFVCVLGTVSVTSADDHGPHFVILGDRTGVHRPGVFTEMVNHAKTLPADPRLKILGIPNRWFIAVAASVFCVVVEMFLNAVGAPAKKPQRNIAKICVLGNGGKTTRGSPNDHAHRNHVGDCWQE